MKKILLFCISIIFFNNINAQTEKIGIGVHFSGYDFYGPQSKHYFLIDRTVSGSSANKKVLLWDPAIRITFWNKLNNYLDLVFALNASSLQYPSKKNDTIYQLQHYAATGTKNEKTYGELEGKIHLNMLSREKYFISPYLFVGLTATSHTAYIGANIPAGIGANINLNNGIYLNLEAAYKYAFTKKDMNHLQYSAGFVFWWGNKHTSKTIKEPIVAAPIVKKPIDTDNDGITDEKDECPNAAGKINGCPDKDDDGIADKNDDCPDKSGQLSLHGCPDKDGDGIADKDDDCPEVIGVKRNKGCPIPDSDNDGFNDEDDKCKDAYSKTNGGCPEIKQADMKKIEMAAKGIYFESGKSVIKPISFANLNKIIEIMKTETTYKLEIDGHTDNSGKPETNLILSQQRADACKLYITNKGIDESRIISKGYGDTMPIADNKTPQGKAQNRRTEFKLKNF